MQSLSWLCLQTFARFTTYDLHKIVYMMLQNLGKIYSLEKYGFRKHSEPVSEAEKIGFLKIPTLKWILTFPFNIAWNFFLKTQALASLPPAGNVEQIIATEQESQAEPTAGACPPSSLFFSIWMEVSILLLGRLFFPHTYLTLHWQFLFQKMFVWASQLWLKC